MCLAQNVKLNFKHCRIKNLTNSIKSRHLEDCLFKIFTTGLLSDLIMIFFPFKWGPHNTTATTIGKNSNQAMDFFLYLSFGHLPWNHLPLKNPPKPIPALASVKNCKSDSSNHACSGKIALPLKWSKNSNHIFKSTLAPTVNFNLHQGFFIPQVRSINLPKNALPGETALHTRDKDPLIDCNSRNHSNEISENPKIEWTLFLISININIYFLQLMAPWPTSLHFEHLWLYKQFFLEQDACLLKSKQILSLEPVAINPNWVEVLLLDLNCWRNPER